MSLSVRPMKIEAIKKQSQADFYRRTADEILQRIYNLGGMTHWPENTGQ